MVAVLGLVAVNGAHMTSPSRPTSSACRTAATALALALVSLVGPASASAQSRLRPTLDLSAGWVGFADDGIVSEGLIGAAFRVALGPRLSIGPEVVHIAGSHHSHLVLTGNVTWDLVDSTSPQAPRITPFVVAGGGVFQTRESFPLGDYTSSEGAFTAGGGVRARASDRVTVGIDARVGWELHLRVNGVVSVKLTR